MLTAILLLIALTLLIIALLVLVFFFSIFGEQIINNVRNINIQRGSSPTPPTPPDAKVGIDSFTPDPNKPLGLRFSQDPDGRDIMEEIPTNG
jgi:hypothetical protein